MRQLWQHIEQQLLVRFPQAENVVTPFSDPLFEIKEYQSFLRTLGYEPVAQLEDFRRNLGNLSDEGDLIARLTRLLDE